MSTRINYLYRDASNYKQAGAIVIAGEVSEAQRDTIAATLDGEEFFIPEQVGFPNPRNLFDEPSDDDHCWCELDVANDFEQVDAPATDSRTADEIVAAIVAAAFEGWDDVTYAPAPC